MERVFMKLPFGVGEPTEVDATPEALIPKMVAGWTQCPPPELPEEVIEDVDR